jgi:hypothetical protein
MSHEVEDWGKKLASGDAASAFEEEKVEAVVFGEPSAPPPSAPGSASVLFSTGV